MKAAAATGDIKTMMKIITNASSQRPSDFIKKTVGAILFVYYMYVDSFHVRPVDMEDLIDGLLYLDAKGYNQEYTMKQRSQK